MKTLLSFYLFVLSMAAACAQGSIRGKVIDEETGEDLIGATIVIQSTQQSVMTDLDGNFIFDKLPKGIYDLECRYLGYGNQKVLGAKVEEDGVKLVYFKLKQGAASDLGLDIVVTAEATEYLETALLGKRKHSLKFLETLSSEEINRAGDETVAESAKRLAAITIERDQYLYIRGLGGRYVKTLVNGGEIAQFDLSYANIGLDLYPSSILENIIVYKNFSADMPGSFAGGALSINTKTFPDKFTLQVDFSTEYHSLSTFNPNFKSFGTFTDPIAALFEPAVRIPSVVNEFDFPRQAEPISDANTAATYNLYTQAFSHDFSFKSIHAIPNMNGSITIGGQTKLSKRKNITLGINAVAMLSNGYSMYENGETGRYRISQLDGTMDTLLHLSDNTYQHSTQMTAMINMSLKLSPRSKIRLSGMRTQRGIITARMQDGIYPLLHSDWTFHNRTWQFDIRRQAGGQLSGQHILGKKNNTTFNWQLGLANSLLLQPDLRYFSYATTKDSLGLVRYLLGDSIGQAPSQYYRRAEEWVIPIQMDMTLGLPLGKLKVGAAFEGHVHLFGERRFFYSIDNQQFDGNPTNYIHNDNFVVWDDSSQNSKGTYIYDATLDNHQYVGLEMIAAAFALWDADISKRLKLSVGFRTEYVNHFITSLSQKWVAIQYPAFMPSLALNYEVKKDMFLRFAVGRTTVRPSFREYTDFISFDYIGDYQIIGNLNLQPSPVNNADLRWEWYLGLREMVAVGAFFKHFANPIERVLNENATAITFRNAPTSFLAGLEVEIRKDFGFFGEWGKKLAISANAAYIHSITKIPAFELQNILAANEDASKFRPLFGQSPFVVNFSLNYRDDDKGTQANLAFNIVGKRLIYEFADGTPDIYELPKPMLDFNLSQQIGKFIRLRFSARNLLGAKQQEAHQLKGEKYFYRQYALGQTFLFGISFLIK